LAPAAFAAAPPSNDDFAEREILGGSLPIDATRSNTGATKESGENISFFAAGHSIWFEWEAQSTGWVTIGACDDGFPTIVGVFTGTELEHLTPAADNADEGPDCAGAHRQFTFKATSGTRYVIAVDGNIFHLPEASTPVTEGEVLLRIEETPPPPNDDFADATALEGPIDEEPGGGRFYFAHTQGYNWKAMTEAGEPFYGADSGASVWYSWTAPESGLYRFGSPCCISGLNRTVYTGDAVHDLTQILAATGPAEVMVTAGATYWIAVWGAPDLAAGEPVVGSFSLFVSTQFPRKDTETPNPFESFSLHKDVAPPQTKISKSRLLGLSKAVKFWFSASEPLGSFLCQLDKRPYKPCDSPRTYRKVGPGGHAFRVKAVDRAGNVDGSPAVAHFTTPRPHPAGR
jgi:hypothetical protein